MAQNLPIVVSGGGIAGLTFSLACLKFGVKPIILEKAKEYQPTVGQGIGLWGPALMALNSLGIEEILSKEGKNMVCAGYKNQELDWLVKPSSNIERLTSCLCVKRHAVQFELYNQLKDQNMIRFNTSLKSFEQKPDKVVVHLDDGTSIDCGLLVGADGVNSLVRNSIFPEIQPEYSGYRYYQGLVSDQSLSEKPAYEAWGPNQRFGLVGLKDPVSFWFTAVEKDFGEKPIIRGAKPINQAEKDKLLDHFSNFGEEVKQVIGGTEPQKIVNTPIFQLPFMQQWHQDRVVLIGDACHAMAPNLAQGACLAIEDAMDLAGSLYKLKFSNIKQNIEHYDFKNEKQEEGINLKNMGEVKNSLKLFQEKRQKRAKLVQFLVPKVHQIGSLEKNEAFIRDLIFKLSPSFISTPIFDITHKWALGMSYTAPNLGQGLYARILGNYFKNVSQGLKKVHTGRYNQGRYCTGTVKITRDQAFLTNLVHSLFDFPQIIDDGRLELRISINENGQEQWNRCFINNKTGEKYNFNSTQYMLQEQFAEYFKGFQFTCDLVPQPENKGFDHELSKVKVKVPFLRNKFVSLPTVFKAQLRAKTIGTENGWNYQVKIQLPSILHFFTKNTLILQYEGQVQNIEYV